MLLASGTSRASLALVLLVFGSASLSEAQPPVVTAPRTVLTPPVGFAFVEPHLAAARAREGLLVGAVMAVDTSAAQSGAYCLTMTSMDNGSTWKTHRLPTAGGCADPWVAFTNDGTVVAAYLARPMASTAGAEFELLVTQSRDGGLTWTDTVTSLGRGQDREVLVPDIRSGAPRAVYVVSGQGLRLDDAPMRWSIYVARSVNAGRSFREPVKIVPSTLNLNAGESAQLPTGELVVTFVDFQRNVDGFRSSRGMLERRRVWAMRSVDNGRNFSPPSLVSERCGVSTYDVIALHDSAHLVLACTARDSSGILVHRSRDAGESWSEQLIELPGRSTRPMQVRLSVSSGGAVGMAWLEVDNSTGCYRPRVALANTAQLAFGESIAVGTPTCASDSRHAMAARRYPLGGDYFGWAADATGAFQLLWVGGTDGAYNLLSASVRAPR